MWGVSYSDLNGRAAGPISSFSSNQDTPCSQLAPAGTGTMFVSQALAWADQPVRHSHHLVSPSASCFLMSLRDPAERVASGFRYELMNPSGGHPRLTRFGNATHFVRLLRVRNPAALKLLARSRRKTVPGDEGSFFLTVLTEQTFYLERAGNRTIFSLCVTPEGNLANQLALWTRNSTCSLAEPGGAVIPHQRLRDATPQLRARSLISHSDADYISAPSSPLTWLS